MLTAQESREGEHFSENRHYFSECLRNDSVLSFKSSKGFFPSTIHNLVKQAAFPFHLKSNQWIFLVGAVAITGTLIHYDNALDAPFKPVKERNRIIADVSPRLTDLGDVYGYALLGGFAGYGICFHNYKAFHTSLLAAEAALTSGIWIRVGKTLTGRMRPGQTYGDPEFKTDHWFGPFSQFKNKYNSNRGIGAFDAFPSGHTGAAFAIATVFANQYSDCKVVPVAAYSLAGLVGITRLIEHEHWGSDVFVGGLIGYLCGKQVVSNEKKTAGNKTLSKLKKKTSSSLFPVSISNIQGIKWTLIF